MFSYTVTFVMVTHRLLSSLQDQDLKWGGRMEDVRVKRGPAGMQFSRRLSYARSTTLPRCGSAGTMRGFPRNNPRFGIPKAHGYHSSILIRSMYTPNST